MKAQRGKKDFGDFPNDSIINVELDGKYLSISNGRYKGSHNHRKRRMEI